MSDSLPSDGAAATTSPFIWRNQVAERLEAQAQAATGGTARRFSRVSGLEGRGVPMGEAVRFLPIWSMIMASLALDPDLTFIENFQSEIDRLGCPAVVQPASGALPVDTMELWDSDGRFITLLPMSVSPATAVLGFGLFQLGLRTGRLLSSEVA